jgi:hypothetical protein
MKTFFRVQYSDGRVGWYESERYMKQGIKARTGRYCSVEKVELIAGVLSDVTRLYVPEVTS